MIMIIEASVKGANVWAPFAERGMLYVVANERLAKRDVIPKLRNNPAYGILDFRARPYYNNEEMEEQINNTVKLELDIAKQNAIHQNN